MENHGGVNIDAEDHDSMEVDDHTLENTFKDNDTNTLIYDTFGIDTIDDDDDHHEIDVFHDILLLEMTNMTLYKGSQKLFSMDM